MTDPVSELSQILIDYARKVGAGSSFSERVSAMEEARTEILELFRKADG